MSKTHWKALADTSQYLGKQHFGPDEKKDVTIKDFDEQIIEDHKRRTKELKAILYFEEPDVRPWIAIKTNRKAIAELLGTPYMEDWIGHKITLWVDPSVQNTFDPQNPGGVRVWPKLPETSVICENCGIVIEPHGNYSANKIVTMSRAKYGQALCWDCAKVRKEATE